MLQHYPDTFPYMVLHSLSYNHSPPPPPHLHPYPNARSFHCHIRLSFKLTLPYNWFWCSVMPMVFSRSKFSNKKPNPYISIVFQKYHLVGSQREVSVRERTERIKLSFCFVFLFCLQFLLHRYGFGSICVPAVCKPTELFCLHSYQVGVFHHHYLFISLALSLSLSLSRGQISL